MQSVQQRGRKREKERKAEMRDQPMFSGIPGRIARFVYRLRRATDVFPPAGMGVGVGIGFGCGLGWPLRRAYGPPRATCGAMVGAGVGAGYAQGFGIRFGRDARPAPLRERMRALERWLDASVSHILSRFRRRSDKQSNNSNNNNNNNNVVLITTVTSSVSHSSSSSSQMAAVVGCLALAHAVRERQQTNDEQRA